MSARTGAKEGSLIHSAFETPELNGPRFGPLGNTPVSRRLEVWIFSGKMNEITDRECVALKALPQESTGQLICLAMGSAPAPGAANGALAVRNASLGIDALKRPHAFCSARGAPNCARGGRAPHP